MTGDEFVTILAVVAMGAGALAFVFFWIINDRRIERAFIVFLFGVMVIFVQWVLEGPDVIELLKSRVGWGVLGIVFAVLGWLGFKIRSRGR